MLYFSRWKAAAIILTALAVCLFAVPNLLSKKSFENLPHWAQRKITLGVDVQGGWHGVFAADASSVRREKLQTLRDDVRRLLREARIPYSGLAVRVNTVEFAIREEVDLPKALAVLRELSWPSYAMPITNRQYGVETRYTDALVASSGFVGTSLTADASGTLPAPEVILNSEGRVIQVKVTDAAVTERIRQGMRTSIEIVERRLRELGVPFSLQREGWDRFSVELPGFQDSWRWYSRIYWSDLSRRVSTRQVIG